MRNIVRLAPALLLCSALFVVSSCTVSQALTIDGAGAGTATVDIRLSPILLAYHSDLVSAVTGVAGDYPVFDPEQLVSEFARRPSLRLLAIERASRGQLHLELAFQDLNGVMAEADGPSSDAGASPNEVFSFTSSGSRRTLTVRLDREAVNRFIGFSPAENAQMMQFLLPPGDGSVGRDEYRDELAWAFEEYGTADEVVRVLEQSTIQVSIRPAGRIERQTGGVIRGESVVFAVPILELLTLAEPRVYEVVFVP